MSKGADIDLLREVAGMAPSPVGRFRHFDGDLHERDYEFFAVPINS